MRRLTLLEFFLVWVAGFGGLSILVRRRVAAWAGRWRLPRPVIYYALATPIVLAEEALTIEVPYFWGIVPMLAAFYILFLPLYLIQRYTRCSWILASLLFGAWGTFNEFILVGRIRQVDSLPVLAILGGLCFLLYAVMALVPTYYLQASLPSRPGGRS